MKKLDAEEHEKHTFCSCIKNYSTLLSRVLKEGVSLTEIPQGL